MDISLYDVIFKRKSFHQFKNTGDMTISQQEITDIENAIASFTPLDPSIAFKYRIVKDEPSCKRDPEYCVLFYSEQKPGYLQNIGYIGEQLDLYLVSKNIGTLWYGIGKPKVKEVDGLQYVIMIAIKKIGDVSLFRQDMFKSKRKPLEETWHLDKYQEIGNIARFAPSARNSQPWDVTCTNNTLIVTRNSSKRGIMPKGWVFHYNKIDIGIYLCFLELCLIKNGISFDRELISDNNNVEVALNCKYHLK